ncbi:MAG: penicillin-binding protein 1C [Symploca sp. SIO3C6]|nr:penicillin-binding protein 1C [Symploca sp. SIO3C6]
MINKIGHKVWRRLSRKSRRFSTVVLVLLLSVLTVRSLPYLAPIKASELIQDQQAIEFSDRFGLPLGTLLTRDQDHTAVVRLKQISPHFIDAILAAEDGQFYHHGPLEMRAIARSLLQAIKARRIVSGASTITMQLARMLEPAPRTLPAKIREIWLSWRLAAGMSKDEILQAYINRLPMGGNIYGVEAAARIYFGMPAAELNIAQASLLAGLPNNPNYLNPYDYWEASKRRQQYVLNRMVEDEYITSTQAERAYAEEILLKSRRQGIIAAPHFLFWLANQLPLGHSPQIKTTIDRSLQQFVEAQVQQVVLSLENHNVHHAAALVIDNHSGEVLAYVGSPDYFLEAQLGRNDGVQALRQPGSTLKPFVYELALEKSIIHPHTILADVPTHYPIPGARLYSPVDYTETFTGPVRVRVALANSLNVPAVRVLEKVGVPTFLERLHQLGFQHLQESAEYYGLGLVLGSGEVSLWELARAYFILANQGKVQPLITNLSNSQLSLDHSQLSNPTTWALITNMLSDRHARAQGFGVDSVLNLPFPTAVKTGTSSNFRDTWTVGFTTDYTVATWVGNFDGEPMRQVPGVMGAAPLWHRIILHLHQEQEPAKFTPPVSMVQRPVCTLSGLRPTPECPSTVLEYFYPEELSEYNRHRDSLDQNQSPAKPAEQLLTNKDKSDSTTAYFSTGDRQLSHYSLNLPEEYDNWLAMQPQPYLAPTKLKILSPSNGDLFMIEPSVETEGNIQRLEFKIARVDNQPVEWWLNGRKLETDTGNSVFWQLHPGEWNLQVKSGEMSDQVSFEVQLTENRLTRRGFSIAKP